MENNESKSRYEVISVIGRGGMATVYLAQDKILNRKVALKLLNEDAVNKDSSALKRFLLEAHATTSLIHPNIVEVYDICDIGNKHFIVMEYVEGRSLKQVISLRGHIPPKEAVWIMKQLCRGIMEAHRNNIIHRDIKPQNVLMKNDGTAKIADFGIAVLNNNFDLTSKDTVLGSVHYLAPELSKGESPSMRSDIYSLGIVFFELITGQVPYNGENAVTIALKHFKEPLPDIKKFDPTIPQSIINIITKATAKDPNERYENVALIIKDLNECLDDKHSNDKAVTIKKTKIDNHKEIFSKTVKNDKFKKKMNTKKILNIVLLSFLSLCSISCIILILLITGVIKFGFNESVTVPDIINMNLNDASDFLLDYGISIDMTNINRSLDDNIPENNIIYTIPEAGSKVDKGSRIQVTVSSGSYFELENFVGKNITEVTDKFISSKILLVKKMVDSDEKPGTIVSQVPSSGYKYSANDSFELTLEYSKLSSITLDLSLKGRSVNDVYNELTSQGFDVEIITKSKDEFDQIQLSDYPANALIYSEPSLGTIYTQEEDNKIELYCYGE